MAIGRDFDPGCEFLQGTYNDAAFDAALPLQKRLRNLFFTVMNIVWTRYKWGMPEGTTGSRDPRRAFF